MSERVQALRRIPPVDALVQQVEGDVRLRALPRPFLVRCVRDAVASYRRVLEEGGQAGTESFFAPGSFADAVAGVVRGLLGARHRPVINATGILLHTGLGRAPLCDAAIEAAAGAGRYAIVEVNPHSGERDLREERIARLLCELTGAEAATAVNNNAAAVLLVLGALAKGRTVIASRGELVEIGGGFRMPDVMAASACNLREVGTTNRTYARDYEAALDPAAAVLLKVHTSNFRIEGFTHAPSVAELAALGRRHGLPVVYDLGSGLLREVDLDPLHDEPTVAAAVRDGADVVTFSGDKLLCGPQAGLIVGRRGLVDAVRAHPLFRAMRPGKLDLAALEATLLVHRRDREGTPELPLYQLLARTAASLREIAAGMARRIEELPGLSARVVDTAAYLGSGSAPARRFPGVAVELAHADLPADRLAARLRRGEPPVFARIEAGRVLLDLRAVFDDQIESLVACVAAAAGGGAMDTP